jgi:putative phosphoribosyl transferase
MKDELQPFHDRRQAGRVLAGQLERYRGSPGLLVLGLARGGVAVAFEVARALQAALDVLVVRKLGFPGNEEYAIGAIASGGVRVMNPLPGGMLTAQEIQAVVERELAELARREQFYRSQRPPVTMTGRTVIVVDDGLATGSTMQAALLAVRQQHPLHLTAAVPVCAAESIEGLAGYADEVICAATPSPFGSVGHWYRDFPQASDDEVCSLLEDARREHVADLKSKKSMEAGQ